MTKILLAINEILKTIHSRCRKFRHGHHQKVASRKVIKTKIDAFELNK